MKKDPWGSFFIRKALNPYAGQRTYFLMIRNLILGSVSNFSKYNLKVIEFIVRRDSR